MDAATSAPGDSTQNPSKTLEASQQLFAETGSPPPADASSKSRGTWDLLQGLRK